MKDCSSPLITLIPNAPSSSKPLQFRRNQDFYITSKLYFNSVQIPSSIVHQWTIFTCSSTGCTQMQLNQTAQKELFIRSQALSSGFYEFRLTVITKDVLSTFSSSAYIYVEIIDSHIVTNLVSFDRLNIKHHSEQVLLLDPGQHSIGPNQMIFYPNVSDI